MPQQIVASELLNIVKYRTDRASFKKVRDDMKKLRNDFSKTEGKIAQTKMKADRQIHQTQAKQQKEVEKQQKQQAKQAAQDAKQQANDQKKLAAARARALKMTQQQNKKAATQQENADLARKRAAFTLGRLQALDGASRYQAIKDANAIVDAYTRGHASLKSMNQALSQHIQIQRSISRQNAKQAKQSGQPKGKGRTSSSNWVSQNAQALVPSALLGPAALAFVAQAGFGVVRNTLAGSIERQRGRKMVNSMGTSTLEADAIRQQVLLRTGQDFSYEKIADISKDVQDKVGQLSLGEWKQDKKTGAWSFSGGGEMADWLKIMTERGGFSREGAMSALQNAKGPGDLAVLLRSLQKSAKLTEAEFTALAEAVNDFSYIAKSVDDNGENLVAAMKRQVDAHLAPTESQQKSIDSLNELSIIAKTSSEALGDQFTASFSESLEKLGLNSKNLQAEFGNLVPIVRELGKDTAIMAKGFSDLIAILSTIIEWKNRITGEGEGKNKSLAQSTASNAFNALFPNPFTVLSGAKDLWDMATGDSGYTPNTVYNQMSERSLSSPSMSYTPQLPNMHATIDVNINPAEGFGQMVDARADQRIEWAFDDQNFQISQSMLGN